jgi:hypothetical protein
MSAILFPEPEPVDAITLSDDQLAAYQAFAGFMMKPDEKHWVLSGYAGTGKSTLVTHMLRELPGLQRMIKLVRSDYETMSIRLTATTNKAAEALSSIVKDEVLTIHSLLGLRVETDYETQQTKLERSGSDVVKNSIIFIDEASFICKALLELIATCTKNCKIIYIGDPAQLVQVGEKTAPLFRQGYPVAQLEKVVRQAAGNPIIEMATAFRNTVNTGKWQIFDLDGHHIQHLETRDFEDAIIKEFDRPDWHHNDSKVLAWTNRRVIYYNENIRDAVRGEPLLSVGDYAVNNSYVKQGRYSIRTDRMVHITAMSSSSRFGIPGWQVTLDNTQVTWFMPESLQERKKAIKDAKSRKAWTDLQEIEETWVDLRAAYACTVNKSQGSTYDKVFIDLDDINKCRQGNQVARLLYVAVSRARHHVILTGEIGSP